MAGEITPQGGSVLLDGQSVHQMPRRALARALAVVPQSAHLTFPFTALDVVMMGRHAHIGRFHTEGADDVRIARAAMAQVGVLDLAQRPATELSGGEWQRVVIARALCQNTPVLLLDEPVASLDIRHQIDVMSLIRALCRDDHRVAVCVLHDLNLAAHYCDRLILLRGGAVLADGAPGEVLTEDNIRRAYQIESVVLNDGGKMRVAPVYEETK
jgi:iron complex transport system ATP-binding protein